LKFSKKLSRKYKLVIDANVIISAVYGGYPEKVMQFATSHEIFAPVSLEKELDRFIESVKCRQEFPHLRVFFDYFLNHIKLITVKNVEKISRDKTDDFYIAAAIQENVDFLVTGDKDLLSCKDIRKWPLKILTPREFIEIIRN